MADNNGTFLSTIATSSRSSNTSELLTYINSNLEHVIGNAGDPAQYKLLYDLGLRYLDKDFSPHVNGFYYVSVESGTWANSATGKNFSSDYKKAINDFQINCSSYITDIDMPNLSLEFDTLSGKARSLHYATKMSYSSDFSLNILNDSNNYCMKYLDCHLQFIGGYRKGTIEVQKDDYATLAGPQFMNIPYFDAVWVIIFKPFSFKIDCVIKILGVAPAKMPFKQIIGDRAKSNLSSLNVNYKSTDMFYKFYGDTPSGPLYDEFITHLESKR